MVSISQWLTFLVLRQQSSYKGGVRGTLQKDSVLCTAQVTLILHSSQLMRHTSDD